MIKARNGLHLHELINTSEIKADVRELKNPIGWSIKFKLIQLDG